MTSKSIQRQKAKQAQAKRADKTLGMVANNAKSAIVFMVNVSKEQGLRQSPKKGHKKDPNKTDLYNYVKPRFSSVKKKRNEKTVFDNALNRNHISHFG